MTHSYKPYVIALVWIVITCCKPKSTEKDSLYASNMDPYIVVLGTVQDGGYPQLGCANACCKSTLKDSESTKFITSLGLYDPQSQKKWLFEATPDLRKQWQLFSEITKQEDDSLDGIFVTHAHMGHYAGLMYLGFESLNTKNVPVYCMPRMKEYLSDNGPWSQLIKFNNILIHELEDSIPVQLEFGIEVMPFRVPHREEFSEVVGYRIKGHSRSAVFIPDIDKWGLWNGSLPLVIEQNDYVFIDATFFDETELPGRDISKVPHPFITETMDLLLALPAHLKQRVYFIHLNHTNPALMEKSDAERTILAKGYNVAREKQKFKL